MWTVVSYMNNDQVSNALQSITLEVSWGGVGGGLASSSGSSS